MKRPTPLVSLPDFAPYLAIEAVYPVATPETCTLSLSRLPVRPVRPRQCSVCGCRSWWTEGDEVRCLQCGREPVRPALAA